MRFYPEGWWSTRVRKNGRWTTGSTERMRLVGKLLCTFFVDERGATAIEYGLVAAGIAAAVIAVVLSLGTNLNGTFSGVSSQLK
jgi:pilus assembly protein Flp/PilA